MKITRHKLILAFGRNWLLLLGILGASAMGPRAVAQEAADPSIDIPPLIGAELVGAEPTEEDTPTTTRPSRDSMRKRARDAYDELRRQGSMINRRELVLFGQNVELRTNEIADQVVVIGGNLVINGAVRNDVVCIGGNISGNGSVGTDVVSVGGNVSFNGPVGADLVAVGGNVNLGTNASVANDVVSVGGRVQLEKGATHTGNVVDVKIWLPFLNLTGISEWIQECVMKARPLAPGLGWLWIVTGVMLLVNLIVALLFGRPVASCVRRLEQQPASTFFTGLLTKILMPLVLGVLFITGVGILAIPFLLVALMVAQWIGKVALCEYLGLQFGRQLKVTAFERPLVAFLFGWVIITALYMVPVIGLVTFGLVGIWSLGVAIVAVFGSMGRERPRRPTPTPRPISPTPTSSTAAELGAATPLVASAESQPNPPAGSNATPPLIEPAGNSWQGVSPEEALLESRAGFWSRTGAALIDLVIVLFCSFFLYWIDRPTFPIVAVIYFTALIAWQGRTIGGVVFNLQVVRIDGQRLTFAVSLVRALAACLSFAVLFLGFLWIAWDSERQSWHDKIAGTYVVRMAKSRPLL